MIEIVKVAALFIVTAMAEIAGCYLTWLWLKQGKAAWLLLPAAISLSAFAWLLTLHPHAAGRVYAAYGGVYVAAAIAWLWFIDGVQPDRWDFIGAAVTLFGTAIIYWGPRAA
ncbi:MAG TPA: YnfA family protein [Burkholderiales bacterium]|nr:YnfA family protein [Burkholderiales bacterium]